MARRENEYRPVSEAAFDAMPDRVGDHFERIRAALEASLDDEE